MDIQKHRLLIASGVLLVLVGSLVFMQKQRNAEYAEGAEGEDSPLPTIVRDQLTSIEITRPEQPAVRLEKQGESFRVAAPVVSPADASNVSALLEKLSSLEFVSIASRSRSSHAQLEVDDAHAVHVVAKRGSTVVADLRIGAYRGGNTMLRIGSSDDVIAVSGSIRYAFAREVKEWRDRVITDLVPGDVRSITFASDQGSFRFERGASGDFAPAAGQAPIARFEASKVDAIVTSLARLRATDFGADSDAAAAGFATPRGTVTLHVETAAGGDAGVARSEDVVLLLGGTHGASDVYVQRQGNATLFVAAGALADKMRPAITAFQAEIPTDAGVAAPPPEAPPMDLGGAGGGQIPPEVLQQLMQQAQQGQH